MDENKILNLAESLYSLTNGLCNAGPGPSGIGVVTVDSSDIKLLLCFEPDPVCDDIVFPENVKDYQVAVQGVFKSDSSAVMPEDIDGLLVSGNPATQTVAAALKQLSGRTITVTADECIDAFYVLADQAVSAAEQVGGNEQKAQAPDENRQEGYTLTM